MLDGLRTVACRVADLDGAKRWCGEVLGHAPCFDKAWGMVTGLFDAHLRQP